MRTEYKVYYGDCGSYQGFTSYTEASRFIKHCLDNDYRNVRIVKEKRR